MFGVMKFVNYLQTQTNVRQRNELVSVETEICLLAYAQSNICTLGKACTDSQRPRRVIAYSNSGSEINATVKQVRLSYTEHQYQQYQPAIVFHALRKTSLKQQHICVYLLEMVQCTMINIHVSIVSAAPIKLYDGEFNLRKKGFAFAVRTYGILLLCTKLNCFTPIRNRGVLYLMVV